MHVESSHDGLLRAADTRREKMSKLKKIVSAALGALVLATALIPTQADALTSRHDGGCCAGAPHRVVPFRSPTGQPLPDPAYVHRAAHR
jgi:hypothetical protein